MNVHDLSLLACPETGAPLHFRGTSLELQMQDGVLVCFQTGVAWTVEQTVPRLYRDEWRVGADAARANHLDRCPNLLEPLYAAAVMLAGRGRAAQARDAVVQALRLSELAGIGHTPRVLEIGAGTGANIGPLLDNLPSGSPGEVWGTDLSTGAIAIARDLIERTPDWVERATVFLADPHHLPFQSAIFDRVLVSSGLAGLRDPTAALRQAARVCRPGGTVVVTLPPPPSANPLARWAERAVGLVQGPEDPTSFVPDCGVDAQIDDAAGHQRILRFTVG